MYTVTRNGLHGINIETNKFAIICTYNALYALGLATEGNVVDGATYSSGSLWYTPVMCTHLESVSSRGSMNIEILASLLIPITSTPRLEYSTVTAQPLLSMSAVKRPAVKAIVPFTLNSHRWLVLA